MRNAETVSAPRARNGTRKAAAAGLTVGAVGIVFGDIGTSPLYVLNVIFGQAGLALPVTPGTVYGVISLIIWSLILVVCLKYLLFVMRADNKGEGGIMALVALLKKDPASADRHSRKRNRTWPYIILGLVGVALFYGNSTITPAISVLSAVEGLRVATPALAGLIVPITLVLITFLFWIQRYGTSAVGKLFGPVMVIWFLVIGAAGLLQILRAPAALQALSPGAAFGFIATYPLLAFVAMGAVILAVTGAEALYADMGHFGRRPIARAWLLLVFPALCLCYIGQGAALLNTPGGVSPFMALFPAGLHIAVIILATAAALIASQAVISGAFSLTRQAIQLGFLPKMHVVHTSDHTSGQIYLPMVNSLLYGLVVVLVVTFGSSAQLAHAYGIAVAGTLAIDSILFLVVVRTVWHKPRWVIAVLAAGFLTIDLLFVASSLPKLLSGGWFPLGLSVIALVLLLTWYKGQQIVSEERKVLEGPLQAFITKIRRMKPPLTRVPGSAVYIGHHPEYAPLALHAAVEKLHELHERVIIVSVRISTAAHIPDQKRVELSDLAYDDGISQVRITYGYHDSPNIPRTLEHLRGLNPELDFNPQTASYFISLSRVVTTRRRNMAGWRKGLYAMLSRNALSTSDYYKLPIERTVEMRSLIEL